MFKSKKIFGIYAALGLLPIFLDALLPTQMDGEILHALTHFFPYPLYMGFALVGFLAFKLNQNRILFAVVVFLLVCFVLFNPLILNSWNIGAKGLHYVIAIAFPITLGMIFSIRESRFIDVHNLSRLILSVIPFVVLGYILARDVAFFKKIADLELIPGLMPQNGFLLPQLSLISVGFFVFVVLMQRDRIIKPFIQVLGIGMIPLMGAIWAGLELIEAIYRTKGLSVSAKHELIVSTFPSLQIVAAFTVICAILLHAIFTIYWQRVYIDELTDIPNRRALDEKLLTLNGEYAIAMMDIDHFKNFNDTYGHDEGDNVLRLVARVMDKELGDKVYRYGGEEFCAVFNKTAGEEAFLILNKVRRQLEEREFHIRKPNSKREPTSSSDRRKKKPEKVESKKVQITISIGVATPCRDIRKPADVIKLADQALYQAKKKGRNCVIVWETGEDKNSSKKKDKSTSPA